jgi:hypothetical protein
MMALWGKWFDEVTGVRVSSAPLLMLKLSAPRVLLIVD